VCILVSLLCSALLCSLLCSAPRRARHIRSEHHTAQQHTATQKHDTSTYAHTCTCTSVHPPQQPACRVGPLCAPLGALLSDHTRLRSSSFAPHCSICCFTNTHHGYSDCCMPTLVNKQGTSSSAHQCCLLPSSSAASSAASSSAAASSAASSSATASSRQH
jgi:hypothetical protein